MSKSFVDRLDSAPDVPISEEDAAAIEDAGLPVQFTHSVKQPYLDLYNAVAVKKIHPTGPVAGARRKSDARKKRRKIRRGERNDGFLAIDEKLTQLSAGDPSVYVNQAIAALQRAVNAKSVKVGVPMKRSTVRAIVRTNSNLSPKRALEQVHYLTQRGFLRRSEENGSEQRGEAENVSREASEEKLGSRA